MEMNPETTHRNNSLRKHGAILAMDHSSTAVTVAVGHDTCRGGVRDRAAAERPRTARPAHIRSERRSPTGARLTGAGPIFSFPPDLMPIAWQGKILFWRCGKKRKIRNLRGTARI